MPSKIKDDPQSQKYEYSFPQVWPDGSQFSVYSSPDNERMVIEHSSGSHIEFKADGSVFVKAVKGLHVNSSVNSSVSGEPQEGEASTISIDGDLHLKVEGAFNVDCKSFDVKSKDNISMSTPSDFNIRGNSVPIRATEQISLESTKSVYVSTKELVEGVTRRVSEVGTKEGPGGSGRTGGTNIMKVEGNTIIQNDDIDGGITIKSAGYLNLVCAAERVDITGDAAAANFMPYMASTQGKATYTHIIRPYGGPNPRGIPGSSYFECGPGGVIQKITGNYLQEILGNRTRSVTGAEKVDITGIQKITANKIFLN